MDWETEIRKHRGTRVLLIVLAIWGLAIVVAAQTGIYKAIYPLVLASIIALGIVVPVIVYAMLKGFRAYIEASGYGR